MSDIPALSDHLLARIAAERGEAKKSLSSSALEVLAAHHWPGNVRELENALRAASIFAESTLISAGDLTENVDDLRGAVESARQRRRTSDPVPPPPSSSPRSIPANGSPRGTDDAATDDDSDGDSGPLPVDEANATSVAYAQVRQGALSLSDMKRQIERDCIARALAETRGNITRAAALLGMKRPRLSQLVKQYGLAVASEAT
jgi:DNA-binding NtrC family response regulator